MSLTFAQLNSSKALIFILRTRLVFFFIPNQFLKLLGVTHNSRATSAVAQIMADGRIIRTVYFTLDFSTS